MFYIIDREGYLKGLGDLGDCFISFIPNNNKFHPITQRDQLSLVFIRPILDTKGYIICINHSESLGISQDFVINYINTHSDRLFVMNKKESMYYFPNYEKLYDLNFIVHEAFEINPCVHFYYRKNESLENINTLIPLSKHYEDNNNVYNKVKKTIKSYDFTIPQYTFNNNELTNAFFEIESQGVKADKNQYLKYYYNEVDYPQYNLYKGRIYGQYNLYTTTGRPSNSFNNINFAALNKTNGIRGVFVPSNDIFLEFDFSAYHPRLLSDLIDYKFEADENVYEKLAKEMFNVETLTATQISNCKELTFKQLYGGVYEQYRHVEFFHKIEKFTDECWETIQKNGFIDTKNKRFYSEEVDNPSKLLNYIIQNYETTNNTEIINRVNNYLKDKKTKIVMYTYDAFLFDYASEDGLSVLREIEEMMGHPVNIKKGKTYKDLIKL